MTDARMNLCIADIIALHTSYSALNRDTLLKMAPAKPFVELFSSCCPELHHGHFDDQRLQSALQDCITNKVVVLTRLLQTLTHVDENVREKLSQWRVEVKKQLLLNIPSVHDSLLTKILTE